MILTIDVGNTNMEYGLFESGKLVSSFRLSTNTNRTSDELGVLACQYFARFNHKIEDVKDVIICSVVPHIMHSLTNSIVKYFGKTPLIVDADVDPGLEYDGDERLGTDRAVAIVAAVKKYGTPLIVLDFGTATTVDAVDPNGKYLGGAIISGLRISTDALSMRTSTLPRIELAKPAGVIGKNTIWQLQAGAVYNFIGGIEHIIKVTKAEMGYPDAKVICTGGLSRLAADNCASIDVIDRSLILDGLMILYNRHKGIS